MSMYNARHLGRLPLLLGEGWGEGNDVDFLQVDAEGRPAWQKSCFSEVKNE